MQLQQGDLDAALLSFQQALAQYRNEEFRSTHPTESLQGEVATLQSLGTVYLRKDNYQQAASYYQEARNIALANGDRQLVIQIWQNESEALTNQQQPELALERLQQALDFSRDAEWRTVSPEESRQSELRLFQNINYNFYGGDYRQGLRLYQQALRLARQRDDQPFVAMLLRAEAGFLTLRQELRSNGDSETLLRILQDALTLYQTEEFQTLLPGDSRQGQIRIFQQLGDIAIGFSNYSQALSYYQQAYNLALAGGDRSLAVQTLNKEVDALISRQHYEQALEPLQQLLSLYQAEESPQTNLEVSRRAEIETLQRIAELYVRLENYEQAASYYRRAQQAADELNNPVLAVELLSREMDTLSGNRVLNDVALERLQHILALYRSEAYRQMSPQESYRGEATTLQRLGQRYGWRGDYQQSSRYYQQARQVALENGDRTLAVQILEEEADRFEQQRLYGPALDRLQQTLVLYRNRTSSTTPETNRRPEIETLQRIGGIYFKLNDYQRSAAYYREAQTLALTTGNSELALQVLMQELSLLEGNQAYDMMLERLQQTLVAYRSHEFRNTSAEESRRGELAVLQRMSRIYSQLENYQRGFALYEQALNRARQIGDRTLAAQILQRQMSYLEQNSSQELLAPPSAEPLSGEAMAANRIANLQRILDLSQEPEIREMPLEGSYRTEAQTLYSIGITYFSQENIEQGLPYYHHAQQLAIAKGDYDFAIQIFEQEINELNNRKLYELGIERLQQLLVTYRDAEFRRVSPDRSYRGEIQTLERIGAFYISLKDYQQSASFYQQARSIALTKGDRLEVARILASEAISLEYDQSHSSALDHLQQALAVYRSPELRNSKPGESRNGEISVLRQIRDIYNRLGDEQQAASYHQQIVEMARALNDPTKTMQMLSDEAISLYRTGYWELVGNHTDAALAALERSLALYRLDEFREVSRAESRQGEIVVLRRIAFLYRCLGDYQNALQYLRKALSLAKRWDDARLEALTQYEISLLYDSLGDYSQALNQLQPYLTTLSQNSDESKGNLFHDLGSFYSRLEQYQRASEYYQQSLESYYHALVRLRSESLYGVSIISKAAPTIVQCH